MASLDKLGTVLATKALCDDEIVGEDVVLTLPDIEFKTTELIASGTINLPSYLTESLEASITKVGIDKGLFNLLGVASKKLEFRFVKNKLTTGGETGVIGYKAFITGIPENIPGGSIEPGSSWSGDVKFSVTRYQLFADGIEKILIDKLKNICKINGIDYAKEINSLL